MAIFDKKKGATKGELKRHAAAGPSPLVVLAGFPKNTAKALAGTINNASKVWRVVATEFPSDDIIYREAAIRDLMGHVCAFAIKARRQAPETITPNRIVLAYVPQGDVDSLLEAFGHSVLPIPLPDNEWHWPAGKHWRFDMPASVARTKLAIGEAESASAFEFRQRLEAKRSDDPLLLPARNFHLEGGDTLAAKFRQFLRREVGVGEVEQEVATRKFRFEQLPRFYARTGLKNKSFAVDRRGLVFAKANVGQDGGHHLIPDNADLTIPLLRKELEGRFRFGTPLEPAGFQHDVQRERDARLDNELFQCAAAGEVRVTGDHTNIFASDVVKGNLQQ